MGVTGEAVARLFLDPNHECSRARFLQVCRMFYQNYTPSFKSAGVQFRRKKVGVNTKPSDLIFRAVVFLPCLRALRRPSVSDVRSSVWLRPFSVGVIWRFAYFSWSRQEHWTLWSQSLDWAGGPPSPCHSFLRRKRTDLLHRTPALKRTCRAPSRLSRERFRLGDLLCAIHFRRLPR
jgi:hypothetical protein